MTTSSRELFRVDPLTGCNNFLSFIEVLAESAWQDPEQETAILFIDMNHMKMLNETRGHIYTDSVIRWMGLLLSEESNTTVFRVGGVEFAIIINSPTYQRQVEIVTFILNRIDKEAQPFGIPEPVVDWVLIRYKDRSPISPESVLIQLNEAMVKAKNNHGQSNIIFDSDDLRVARFAGSRWKPVDDSDTTFSARWISHRAVNHVLLTAKWLDEAQHAAYTDTISGLPNMRAAMLRMEQAVQNSLSMSNDFSILLIDGDNMRAYNDISYVVGDDMIRDMSAVLKNNLRPGDFVARWRSGDEFIVILPDTEMKGAQVVAERFCLAMREISRSWRFPTTISIGIASFPCHASEINTLIDRAENALKHSKEKGKDRATIAD